MCALSSVHTLNLSNMEVALIIVRKDYVRIKHNPTLNPYVFKYSACRCLVFMIVAAKLCLWKLLVPVYK